jgi:quercetin dioxygenase-like cupin family protein
MTAKLAAGLLITAAFAAPAPGQPRPHAQTHTEAQPVQRAILQEQPFPGPVDHTVMLRTVVARGAEVAPHTHPGIEMTYIAGGQALVRITGRPPQDLAAGGSFSIPDQVVHSVRNAGQGPLIMISTYVVDRRKPLASPAPGAR